MFVGSQHVEEPFVTLGQYATFFYFFYFLVVIPLVGIIENTLVDLALIPKKVFLKL